MKVRHRKKGRLMVPALTQDIIGRVKREAVDKSQIVTGEYIS